MWTIVFIGCILIVFTIFVHASATRLVMFLAIRHADEAKKHRIRFRSLGLSIIVLIMFFASIFESFGWAVTYLMLGALANLEEALYFSIVTFTTLGYGDITLSGEFRLLASFEAANGIIIFGWSTAIIMAVAQRFYTMKK